MVEEQVDAAAPMIKDVQEKLSGMLTVIKQLQGTIKQLSKEYVRLEKEVSKRSGKKGKGKGKKGDSDNSTPRPPSGFAKPTKLTSKLCDFLNILHDSELSRTEVTRKINAYVKEHKLQNPANLKEIIPDDNLESLLNTKAQPDKVLTYFNLQTFMKPLFISSK